ncbi:B-cell receptor CD22-like, partial [Nelusetta ayraudi]|uniref:B-cell receptor CD22-like n=1 Tax=Nelusetta ayraudi TaxID=303726 RepID=UPI003F6F9D91
PSGGPLTCLACDWLCPTVVRTQDSWGIDYHHRHICAVKGSTVNISATYWHPDWATVQETNWLVPENSSRGTESCDNRNCILTIEDLRESDAAQYWLSFITNRGKYVTTSVPGVTLSVTDPRPQIRVSRPAGDRGPLRLSCESTCHVTGQPAYTWYRNGQKAGGGQILYLQRIKAADRFSCGLSGFRVHSPAVYAPRFARVSVSPLAGLLEGDTVTLNCSSDANPAVSYIWYKTTGGVKALRQTFSISHFSALYNGHYRCQVRNGLGSATSRSLSLNVEGQVTC